MRHAEDKITNFRRSKRRIKHEMNQKGLKGISAQVGNMTKKRRTIDINRSKSIVITLKELKILKLKSPMTLKYTQ